MIDVMFRLLAAMLIGVALTGQQATIRLYSEFQRIATDGSVVAEITSP